MSIYSKKGMLLATIKHFFWRKVFPALVLRIKKMPKRSFEYHLKPLLLLLTTKIISK
jgi:hypothetical protein